MGSGTPESLFALNPPLHPAVPGYGDTNANVASRFFTAGFEIDTWPEWSPGSGPTLGSIIGPSASNELRFGGASGAVQYIQANALQGSVTPTFVAGDKVTIRVDMAGNLSCKVNGAASGTPANIAGKTWVADAASTVQVGYLAGYGRQLDGVISRPRAL